MSCWIPVVVAIILTAVVTAIVISLILPMMKNEKFEDAASILKNVSNYQSGAGNIFGQAIPTIQQAVSAIEQPSMNLIQSGPRAPQTTSPNYFGPTNATSAPSFTVASSLLPKDKDPDTEWGVPDSVKSSLKNQTYLSATQRVGNNTTNGVMRNASLDIRNEIPNPMTPVSVWNASTISPDLYKRQIE
jgi:hypothetical protein